MNKNIVKIGGASGAWGDSPLAIGQLLTADVDYLMMDYLAEVTMSLLARARLKDSEAGFPFDFVGYLKPHLVELKQRGIRVASNAGGVNPQGCKRALEAAGEALGLKLRVAVVEGDNLMPQIDELRTLDIREFVSGASIPAHLLTANAYLGAIPIARAFDEGADIVVCGRCVDSALALGMLIHEFGWRADQYDLLAAGSLVGHLLECGPQSTGGIFTDWEAVPGWHNIGYPIAECRADGSFVLTKPENTGGLVSPATVAEQLLYEIGDPACYLLPDVTADFSQVVLSQVGLNCVSVEGARGRPPSAQYKVSATYQDGWRAVAMVSIVGVHAVGKAEKTAHALVERARMVFGLRQWPDFRAVHVEVLGSESSYAEATRNRHCREVILRLVVEHADPKALDAFARELGSVGLGCAQGTTGLIGGRPKATPVVRLFTFFVNKAQVARRPTVQIGQDREIEIEIDCERYSGVGAWQSTATSAALDDSADDSRLVKEKLLRFAHARSGDKGDSSNIAIICRRPEYMNHLGKVLTAERLADHFKNVADGPVTRYTAPGISAYNFVLENALGGGGMASLRLDAQGKAYGQRALEMLIDVPVSWVTPDFLAQADDAVRL